MRPRGIMWRLSRWLISRAANLTPEVVYYAAGWPVWINDQLVVAKSQDRDGQTAFTTAMIAVACASSDLIQVGDTATTKVCGVTRNKVEVGDFEIAVRRLA